MFPTAYQEVPTSFNAMAPEDASSVWKSKIASDQEGCLPASYISPKCEACSKSSYRAEHQVGCILLSGHG
jgi:hypothetical protein